MAPRARPIRRPASARLPGLAGAFRLGYVPLVDAAPLLVAESLGLFASRGLTVSLSAELGWGSIREKIVYGELDFAQAPGPLLFSILLGTDSRACGVSTDFVLNLQGNGITLSRRFWDRGVRDTRTFHALVRGEAPHKPTFAVVARFSSHHFLLRKWLRSAGLDPDRDVRIVVLPPPLVAEHMKERQIDGFCAGEPWNSAAALSGEGWVVATSVSLALRHPEKVLLARNEVVHRQPEGYAALREAILEACRFCDQTENRRTVADILCESRVFPVAKEAFLNSLVGPFHTGIADLEAKEPFLVFHQGGANEATRERAQWCLEAVAEVGALTADGRTRKLCMDAFLDERDADYRRSPSDGSHSIAK
jgi:ABC-type nitrate/sulfonate/bicarbonate transport system substrate-binding protein